ncbi:MAG: OmpA family protein [Elusimicrobiales bacterium]|nr:OmpA family protein [Elusimicrobiales bacterium]
MNLFKRLKKKNTGELLWLIVLSDIMTNLMLFFLMLYVFTIQGAEAQKAFAASLKNEKIVEKEKKAEELIQELKEKDAAKTISMLENAEVQITSKEIRVNIESPVLFKSGSADLGNQASTVLDVMGNLMNNLKNDVIIEGHSDNIPIKSGDYPNNWELSAARANTVVDYLTNNFSIEPRRLISAAYGEYRPIASNKTRAGRIKNRRIEIVIMRK